MSSTRSVTAADPAIDFTRDVAPILSQHCIRCHQPALRKGDLSLATKADLVANDFLSPGQPDSSHLLEVVTPSGGAAPLMPQEGAALSDKELRTLRDWIATGAPWPDEVVVKPRPKADRSWWSLRPLSPTIPPADGVPVLWQHNPIDRFVFAKLAAAGLAPNPPADRRTLIRRVTFDLTGLPPTPAEIEAFIADESHNAYERLVDRLLASPRYGEQLGRKWLDVVRFGESTGFEVNHLIDNVWPYRDYVIRSFNEDKPFDRFVIEQLAGDSLAPGDAAVEIGLAFLVCGPVDIVGNQDAAQAAQIRADTVDEMIRATGEAFLGLTIGCARCHDHKFDPITQRDYYSLYASLAGVFHDDRELSKQKLRIGRFEQPAADQCVFERGDAQRKGERVAPASMDALADAAKPYALPPDASENERRLALAKWLIAPDNPLTPRVLANRLWQHYFGAGIVATPNDFGYMGQRPSHPELLDWLARQLIDSGWRIKALQRRIVTSQTYVQASLFRADAARVDSDSRLLWRFPPRRLSAEEIRDSMLFVSGRLNEQMGGPGFRLYQYTRDNVATYTPLDTFGPETFRRAVYHQNARASRIDLLSDFDAPDCAFSAARRVPTTTPSQALALFNHSFTTTMSDAFAERLIKSASAEDARKQIELAFELAYGRAPTPRELETATALVHKEFGLRALCRALLNSNEFIYLN